MEIDRVLVDILQQHLRSLIEARFGVSHCRGRIAIHRAEIPLPVDQRQAQRPGLRHPHQRVVNRLVAVRMVFTHDVSDDPGGFFIGLIGRIPAFAHSVENAAVDGLEAVAHIGQSPADDHAHRVIEIGLPHLLFEGDGGNADGFGNSRITHI